MPLAVKADVIVNNQHWKYMYQRKTKPKDLSVFEQDYTGGWVKAPALTERPSRHPSRFGSSKVPEYLPKWQWALLMRSMERQERPPLVVVNALRPASKGLHWHTFKVAVITLLAAPIVLWAVPVVFEFYFAR